jgi:hypothetical protein
VLDQSAKAARGYTLIPTRHLEGEAAAEDRVAGQLVLD